MAPVRTREQTAQRPAASSRPPLELPEHYGIDMLVAIPRDPDALFVYWEVRDEVRSRVHRQIGLDPAAPLRDSLRVAVADHPSGDPTADVSWTIDLPPYTSSWHVEIGRPDRRVRITLGVRHEGDDGFHPLLEPVEVRMPRRGASEDDGVTWAKLGEHGLEPVANDAQERPSAETTERLMRHARSANAGASHDWPAAHRLLDIDFGGHSTPRSGP